MSERPAMHATVALLEDARTTTSRAESPCSCAAAMCDGGRILRHLKQNIDDQRSSVVLVTYQAPDSLGRRLLEPRPTIRFHGRNYKNWWSHGEAEDRYNYLYTPEEQRELASDVQDVAAHTSETYAFYNNHYGAKAVVNALQLQTALGQPPATLELPEPLRATFPDLLGA